MFVFLLETFFITCLSCRLSLLEILDSVRAKVYPFIFCYQKFCADAV